jgi:general secretion pathway protein M
MNPLTPRERRILALGLLVMALALVWLAVIQPLAGGFIDRARQRQDLAGAYHRNARLIASLPALRAQAEAQRALAPRFAILAPSAPAATQAFMDRLRHLAADEGIAVKGMEDLQADAPAGAVKLRADLTLTLTQLYELIRRLQSEDAYVAIDYLSVSADRSFAAGRLNPLDVRLELSAAWQTPRGRS